MSTVRKPILCLDFDGVLHGYQSGWQGADVVSDPPVPGAMDALAAYTDAFRVAVYSSRSGQPVGLAAISYWLHEQLVGALGYVDGSRVYALMEWPTTKPPAVVMLDDRALTFTGTWPSPQDLAAFQPWNKREPVDDDHLVDALMDAISSARGMARGIGRQEAGEVPELLREHGYRIVRI